MQGVPRMDQSQHTEQDTQSAQLVEPFRRSQETADVAEMSRTSEPLRQAHAELADARRSYSAVFRLAPVGYMGVYEDSVIKEINPRVPPMRAYHM